MTRADLGMWQGRDLLELHGFAHVPNARRRRIAVLKGLQGGVGHFETDKFPTAGGVVEYNT